MSEFVTSVTRHQEKWAVWKFCTRESFPKFFLKKKKKLSSWTWPILSVSGVEFLSSDETEIQLLVHELHQQFSTLHPSDAGRNMEQWRLTDVLCFWWTSIVNPAKLQRKGCETQNQCFWTTSSARGHERVCGGVFPRLWIWGKDEQDDLYKETKNNHHYYRHEHALRVSAAHGRFMTMCWVHHVIWPFVTCREPIHQITGYSIMGWCSVCSQDG